MKDKAVAEALTDASIMTDRVTALRDHCISFQQELKELIQIHSAVGVLCDEDDLSTVHHDLRIYKHFEDMLTKILEE